MLIHNLTVKKIREGLLKRKFSAFELTREFFNHINKKDSQIKAYLSLSREKAYEQAAKIDVLLAEGGRLGSLTGVPMAIKDNILIEGEFCTAGSKILKDYIAVYDATVIKKLRQAGAIFLGKTNLDEFAMGSSTENSAFHPTHNPHDVSRVPGGSSGGSAAAVAIDMAVAALGSDTGGSIRQPAGFCGVVGLKPTYGRVSRFGLIAMASSLDQIGPIAKTVEDAEIILKAIEGKDFYDATSKEAEPDKELKFEDLKNLTVGLPEEYFNPALPDNFKKEKAGLEKEVGQALEGVIKTLETLKIKFKKVSLPHSQYALSCYYIIMPAEVSTNLARFDGLRYGSRLPAKSLEELYFKNKNLFGQEAKKRIVLGTFVLSSGYYDAYYKKAQQVRALIKNDFERVFDKKEGGVDMLLAPTSPTLPFKINERTADPLAMYLSDILTIPANLAGLPALSVPAREKVGKLPVGFQLIGRPWQEWQILGLGKFYERLYQKNED